MSEDNHFTLADQVARFTKAVQDKNPRVLDIDSIFKPSEFEGKIVLVTGGNRGIGNAIAKELVKIGAETIITTRTPFSMENVTVIDGIDVTENDCGEKLVNRLNGKKIDILINNAGYFYEPVEKVDSLNFGEELKMIDICAIGPLRISSALYNHKCFNENAKIAMITSQGGSINWRTIQNPTGGDYGHHMSKAAANMMSVLFAQEMKASNISVGILHPGFNKTDMTNKYSHIWDIEGAVDASIGAKRVLHEISNLNMSTTGKFINCEDGLEIPF